VLETQQHSQMVYDELTAGTDKDQP